MRFAISPNLGARSPVLLARWSKTYDNSYVSFAASGPFLGN